jgi:hypothetical protein
MAAIPGGMHDQFDLMRDADLRAQGYYEAVVKSPAYGFRSIRLRE